MTGRSHFVCVSHNSGFCWQVFVFFAMKSRMRVFYQQKQWPWLGVHPSAWQLPHLAQTALGKSRFRWVKDLLLQLSALQLSLLGQLPFSSRFATRFVTQNCFPTVLLSSILISSCPQPIWCQRETLRDQRASCLKRITTTQWLRARLVAVGMLLKLSSLQHSSLKIPRTSKARRRAQAEAPTPCPLPCQRKKKKDSPLHENKQAEQSRAPASAGAPIPLMPSATRHCEGAQTPARCVFLSSNEV